MITIEGECKSWRKELKVGKRQKAKDGVLGGMWGEELTNIKLFLKLKLCHYGTAWMLLSSHTQIQEQICAFYGTSSNEAQE